MRLAAIDIGTNSVHMIIVRVRSDFSFEVIDREKEMVRLGAGGLDGKRLTDGAMQAALQALSKFRRLADSHDVDEIVAGATSATREAENGGDFLAAIEQQTGIRARVISGAEEAHLIHLAAAYGVGLNGGTGVVVDIGGGSVEITCGPAHEPLLARSFKAGVIRLAERFVRTDPIAPRDERRIVRFIERQVGPHIGQIVTRGFTRVVGTSGTILSLGALATLDQTGHLPTDVRNLRVSTRALRRVRKRLTAMDQRERLEMPGLDPRRTDLAVGGIILLDTILRLLGAEELTLCDLALREGLVLDYIRRHEAHIATVERYPDIRRRSVVELAERCHAWSAHSQQVARLALSLFDQTRPVHGLGDREREWLEFGALLHDVGVHISYERHHKHSYYLIKHGDLRGFDPDEIETIALVARSHRRGRPKASHDGFCALGARHRRATRVLAAFTTLAEGLDRSQAQVVTDVEVVDRGDDMVLRVQAASDAELEIWAAGRHLGPVERVLGKPMHLEAVTPMVGVPAEESAQDAAPGRRRRPTRRVAARSAARRTRAS